MVIRPPLTVPFQLVLVAMGTVASGSQACRNSRKRPAAHPKGLDMSQPVVHLEGSLGTIARRWAVTHTKAAIQLSRPKQPSRVIHFPCHTMSGVFLVSSLWKGGHCATL